MIDLRRPALLAMVLAAPLAVGCSKGAGKGAGAAAPASAGHAAPAAAQADEATGPVITPDQMPVLKAGLWETTRNTSGGSPAVDKVCHSGKPMKAVNMGKACSNLSARRTLLGGFVMDATCAMGPMTMKMHMKASGDWSSHYSVDTTSDVKMQGQPEEVKSEHQEARYLGPCPAGMEADDAE